LKDQLFAVGREVRLSVFAAEGQLLDVAQVFFAGQAELIVCLWKAKGDWDDQKKQ
jgi:hypothetical protein